MAEDWILADLQRGEFCGVHEDVKKYIYSLVQDKKTSEKQRKRNTFLVIKFLHVYVTKFDLIDATEVTEALEVIWECYNSCRVHQVELKQPLMVQELIYSLISKIAKQQPQQQQKHHHWVTKLADLLFEDLLAIYKSSSGALKSIPHNAFVILWNVALQLEQKEAAPHGSSDAAARCVALRTRAMLFLALSAGDQSMVIERLSYALDKLELVLSGKNKLADMDGLQKEALVYQIPKLITQMVLIFGLNVGTNLPDSAEMDASPHCCLCFVIYLKALRFYISQASFAPAQEVVGSMYQVCCDCPCAEQQESTQNHHQSLDVASGMCDVAVCVLKEFHSAYGGGVRGKSGGQKELRKSLDGLSAQVRILDDLLRRWSGERQQAGPTSRQLHLLSGSVSVATDCLLQASKLCSSSDSPAANTQESGFEELLCLYSAATKLLAVQITQAEETDADDKSPPESTKNGPNQQQKQLRRQEITVRTNKLNAMATWLQSQKDYTCAEVQDVLHAGMADVHGLAERINVWAALDVEPLCRSEHRQLASVAYKFGRLCYCSNLWQLSTSFMTTVCRQLREWVTHTCPSDTELEKAHIWAKHELLAEAQRISTHHQEALDTVVLALRVPHCPLQAAADMWVKVKVDMFKHKVEDSVLIESMLYQRYQETRVCGDGDPCDRGYTAVQLLEAEHVALRGAK